MQGTTENPSMALFLFRNGDNYGTKSFILENGNIQITVSGDDVRLKGTKQNDELQKQDDLKISLYGPELWEVLNTRGVSITPEQQQQYLEANKEIEKADLEFLKKHINTEAGIMYFLNSYYNMGISLENREELIQLMDEKTRSLEPVKQIIITTENEARIKPGNTFTDFALSTPEGDILALSDLVGKTDYLLIDFWASWCGPCLRTFPELTAFYKEHKGDRFEILGVSLDDAFDAWVGALDRYGLDWKHVSDLRGWQSEAGQIYAVSSIPRTFLIDKEGKIVGMNLSLEEIAEYLK